MAEAAFIIPRMRLRSHYNTPAGHRSCIVVAVLASAMPTLKKSQEQCEKAGEGEQTNES